MPTEPLAVPVGEAARRLGIGRSLAYDLIRSGQLRSVIIGKRRRLVPVEAIESLLESTQQAADA